MITVTPSISSSTPSIALPAPHDANLAEGTPAGVDAAPHDDPLQRVAADQGLHPVARQAQGGWLYSNTHGADAAPAHARGRADASTFVGMQLGVNGYGEAVVVKREIGSLRGYDDRLQAIAVARLGGAEPAAVVQGRDGRWHALETTAVFHEMRFRSNDTPTRAAYGLPSGAAMDRQRQHIAGLERELGALDDATWPRRSIEDKRGELLKDLSNANRQLASLILGVPESEVQLNRRSNDRTPGMVNITGQPGQGSAGAAHGAVGGDGTFDPKVKTAFEINRSELANPVRAQAALFHEVTHLKDHQFAQSWVQRYVDSGRIFVAGAMGEPALRAWLAPHVKAGHLSKAEAELVLDQASNRNSTTEARANVRTFMALLQSHSPQRATQELVAYAKALPPGRQYDAPPTGSAVTAGLRAELKAEYARMSPEQRTHYDAAVAAAVKANPNAWIVDLRMSK
jgi:hypothetical protein